MLNKYEMAMDMSKCLDSKKRKSHDVEVVLAVGVGVDALLAVVGKLVEDFGEARTTFGTITPEIVLKLATFKLLAAFDLDNGDDNDDNDKDEGE